MQFEMDIQVVLLRKGFKAILTLIRLFIGMSSHMLKEFLLTFEEFVTFIVLAKEEQPPFNGVFVLPSNHNLKL